MSCGGPTKKMQNGGLTTGAKKVLKQGPIKTIKTIRKAVNKITKPTTPKMELGGSLETFQNGGTTRNARTGKHTGGPLSCFERAKRTNKNRKFWNEGGGKTIKNIGKTVLGAGALVGAGAVAYKKNSKFKGAVDELKGKLGFNQTGGAVKKYATGGSIKKKDCPDGYTWDGTNCVKAGPFRSLGAKLGVGAGAAGLLGIATSMTIDKIKDMKAKKKAKKEKEKNKK
jgi:hypothetical protein